LHGAFLTITGGNGTPIAEGLTRYCLKTYLIFKEAINIDSILLRTHPVRGSPAIVPKGFGHLLWQNAAVAMFSERRNVSPASAGSSPECSELVQIIGKVIEKLSSGKVRTQNPQPAVLNF
jgi:hypothetical protein